MFRWLETIVPGVRDAICSKIYVAAQLSGSEMVIKIKYKDNYRTFRSCKILSHSSYVAREDNILAVN